VTEAEPRAVLRAFVAVGERERRIAEQRWEAVPDGWTVPGELPGMRFRLEWAAGGRRVVMAARGGGPAAWTVPAR